MRTDAPRVATASDVAHASAILARAFAADPVMNWMSRSEDARDGALRALFHFTLATSCIPGGQVLISAGDDAVTAWCAPGGFREVPPPSLLFRNMQHLGGMVRGFRVARLLGMEPMLRKHPAEPHWYLFAVGVTPEQQGRGLGGVLLRRTLERVDAEGMPAYLENSNPRNTRLYASLGFQVMDTYRAAPDAPELLLMWRPARGSAGGGAGVHG